MEDILDLYEVPYNSKRPVVCFDERSVQLVEDVFIPIPMKPGKPERTDYHYRRKGVCALMVAFEPLTWQRFVQVREHRTKKDYAEFMKELASNYPEAEVVRLVQENLNTHSAGAFYERFGAEEARTLTKKFEIHYTPKRGSWLNIVEIELSALAIECINGLRIGDIDTLEKEVQACVRARNKRRATVEWRFRTKNALQRYAKLKRLYILLIINLTKH